MIDKYHKHHMNYDYSKENTDIPPRLHKLTSLPSPILTWIDQHLHGFITVWDEYDTIIHVSSTIEKILGYTAADVVGTKWFEKISGGDMAYIKETLDANPNISRTFYVTIQDADGNNVHTETIAAKIVCENKKCYYAASIQDITDQKEAEEMMIRSEKMSVAGQLAAGIAHEIRNPLTSLKGFLQLLQAGVKHKDEYYQIMVDEIEKMEAITSELLFISKPLTDHKEWESLPELIDDVITLLRSQAKLKNITILREGENSLYVNCDRSQIKQVFINLLKNAIEAMDKPGYIKINYRLIRQTILIDIVDEGEGVPEEIIHKLGEPFFTTKQSGTGLGIMITKQILDRHQGDLEIMHNADKGSTFRITLPWSEVS
ncbi:ATP-binding protein [Lentibacillus cibarius]|nr:ATP-binding protein [Lentibacillus cibarius]